MQALNTNRLLKWNKCLIGIAVVYAGACDLSEPPPSEPAAEGEESAPVTATAADDGAEMTAAAAESDSSSSDHNQAPICSNAAAYPDTLWPPNHKLEPIKIVKVYDPDRDDKVTIKCESIYQDEPLNARGDGDTEPDATCYDDKIYVRAERSGTGDGRVYHIKFKATDKKGKYCYGEVKVCVPHDQGKGSTCVDQGPLYKSTKK